VPKGSSPAGCVVAFDFGENWRRYARSALDSKRIDEAGQAFGRLFEGIGLKDRTFLDIGFGQGLSLLLACRAGARVVGCDINSKCTEALAVTRTFFPDLTGVIPTVVGSILDASTVERLRALAAPDGDGLYDIVHSWGVLHHTGDMTTAIRHATSLVRPGGHLVLAIYNQHWSSRLWLVIKWLYVRGPHWLQRALVGALYPVIFAAKWLVTHRSPLAQQRGMDFYYNVVDWVGGYPYEYASIKKMNDRLQPLGFTLEKTVPAQVPTGCNEFVYRRTSTSPAQV
jgi:2-polyprenyl-6-hydroxyphenyl methylase/3-demethylubiquinone-9 3-methyltransferase